MTYGFFNDSEKFRRDVLYWHLPELATLAGQTGLGKTQDMAESYFLLSAAVLADEVTLKECLK